MEDSSVSDDYGFVMIMVLDCGGRTALTPGWSGSSSWSQAQTSAGYQHSQLKLIMKQDFRAAQRIYSQPGPD